MPCPNCFGLLPGERDTGSTAPRYCQCYPTYPQPPYWPPIEQPDDRPTLRDQLAITILHKLMDRYDQTGYNDQYAICEAWKLADFALSERNRGKG